MARFIIGTGERTPLFEADSEQAVADGLFETLILSTLATTLTSLGVKGSFKFPFAEAQGRMIVDAFAGGGVRWFVVKRDGQLVEDSDGLQAIIREVGESPDDPDDREYLEERKQQVDDAFFDRLDAALNDRCRALGIPNLRQNKTALDGAWAQEYTLALLRIGMNAVLAVRLPRQALQWDETQGP